MINIAAFKRILARLYTAFGLVAVAGPLFMAFTWAHAALHDLDIWLHLKAGQLILEQKAFLYADPFSFTFPAKPWVDHEWLFQIFSYLVYSRWQADGLIVLTGAMLVLSFLVLFFIGRRAGIGYPALALLMLITVSACAGRFNIRPEIFSLFFFALYLYILRFSLNKKIIWLLAPLQALWVNFHGYFSLGPLLIFIFFFAEFLRRSAWALPWQWQEEAALSAPDYRRLKNVFFFALLACLLSPNGIKGALYPAYVLKEVILGQHQVFFEYIQELKPTFGFAQGSNSMRNFYLIVILAPLTMLANYRRLKIADLLLLIVFFLFSFKIRNIAFFVFTGYLVIVLYWRRAVERCTSGISLSSPLRQALYFVGGLGVSLMIIFSSLAEVDASLSEIYYDFYHQEFKSALLGVDQRRYPVEAADFLLRAHLPGNMFNDFNSGAYLIGRTSPARKVFIDGRTEFYGQDFFRRYISFLDRDAAAFNSIVNNYRINAVFLNTAMNQPAKVIKYLYASPEWKIIFMDAGAVIFLKDSPANRELIDRYRVDLKSYKTPAADIKSLGFRGVYPAPYIKRAKLFDLLEEDGLVEQEAREALHIMPGCAEAYHYLGKVALRKKMYEQARENFRWAALFFSNNSEILVDLAACLIELKEFDPAISALKKAMRLSPGYGRAQYQLGLVYLAQKGPKEALPVLRKALKLATQDQDQELVREIEAKLNQSQQPGK